jgi:lipoprotein-releasing system ATP-binding protein
VGVGEAAAQLLLARRPDRAEQGLFFQLRDEMGQAFLVVTHNEELASMSDRVVHMRDGLVV